MKRCCCIVRLQVEGVATEPRTLLKYAIEVALPRTTRLLGVLEPFLERVVYEVISSWCLWPRTDDLHNKHRNALITHQPPAYCLC